MRQVLSDIILYATVVLMSCAILVYTILGIGKIARESKEPLDFLDDKEV